MTKPITKKPPTAVDILGHTYEIKWCEKEIMQEKADTGNECMGLTRNMQQEIVVDPSYHPQQQRDTLLHEMLHAISWCAVVDYVHAEDASQAEEHVVNQLAPHLLLVFKQNPAVFAWLSRED